MYYLDRTDNFEKQLKKFSKHTQAIILKRTEKLKTNPEHRGKFVGTTLLGLKLFELRFNLTGGGAGIRVYYIVVGGVVIIEEIVYEGRIKIADLDDDKKYISQHKTINKIILNN